MEFLSSAGDKPVAFISGDPFGEDRTPMRSEWYVNVICKLLMEIKRKMGNILNFGMKKTKNLIFELIHYSSRIPWIRKIPSWYPQNDVEKIMTMDG